VRLAVGKITGDGSDGPLTQGDRTMLEDLKKSFRANSFSGCFRCSTCTNSCPVVQNYEHPRESLGLLPHQMMYAIGLRCWDQVFGSKMLWDCLGCYKCQDNCPQRVAVADIFYELKNRAIAGKYDEPARGNK